MSEPKDKRLDSLEKARKTRASNKTKKKTTKKKVEYPPTIAGYNPTTRVAWSRAMTTNSRKNAIRAMCLLCLGGSPSDVKTCTEKNCPLWKFRIKG